MKSRDIMEKMHNNYMNIFMDTDSEYGSKLTLEKINEIDKVLEDLDLLWRIMKHFEVRTNEKGFGEVAFIGNEPIGEMNGLFTFEKIKKWLKNEKEEEKI